MSAVLAERENAITIPSEAVFFEGNQALVYLIKPDGTVGNVEVIRSLDPTFGLDQEAVKAAKQWLFRPGMRMGEPVSVLVTIELTFTLR